MKAHTQEFKQNICLLGRELNSIITYTENNVEKTLNNEDINSITPHFQSAILKSAMRGLEIDSNVEIQKDTVVHFEFGVKVREEEDFVDENDDGYDYINYGDYIVKSVEKQEDTNSYLIQCYDFMLKSMVDYEALNITYPITIKNFLIAICDHLGLTFKNTNDTFPNYNQQIPNELYLFYNSETETYSSLNYTFRDVLDELAQVTASTICIDMTTNKLELRYINNTNDIIDEEYLKDVNVNFGEKFGAINTVVLSRSAGADNVYYPSTLPENPIEYKIVDNQIMNGNNRADYLPAIYNVLNGLEYYINDFASTGICYYDICDRYAVNIGENTYSCVMFNDEVNITQGLEENVYTDMPEQTNIDYTKADKDDRKINETWLIVDKQNGVIESLASQIVEVSKTITGTGQVQLENAHEGILHKLSISGQISLLFPQNENNLYGYPLVPSNQLTPSNTLTPSSPVPYENEVLYPSSTLYPRGSMLLIDDVEYELDFDFLNYYSATVYDEFIYEDGECKIIRRVGINSSGNKYALDNEVVEYRKPIQLLVRSNSIVKLKSFNNAIYNVEYLLENVYTDNFATQVDVAAQFNIQAGQIKAKVSQDDVVASINLAMEKGQGVIECKSNQFSVDSDNFKLDRYGNMEANNGTFRGTLNTSENCTVGNDLYIGKNQGDENQDDKYIYLSDSSYILRTKLWNTLDLLRFRTQDTMYFEINDDSQNPTNALSLNYYDLIIQNINQYIWLHNGYISSSSAIVNDSDKRLKQNIKDIEVSWINDLKVKQYELIKSPEKKHVGLIAQDYLDKDYKDLFVVKKEDGYYAIDYQNITNSLIQYCQELNKKIEKLEKEMEELKNGFSRISK